MLKRIKSDKGLMGPTHALSALAIALLFTWLAKDIMFKKILGTNDTIVYITAIIIIVGSSLMPDLDAVNSTVINVLGIIGKLLSSAMRGFSTIIQSTIKGPNDKSSDPHRGFWHTIIASLLVGLLVTSLTNINIKLFTVYGVNITIANLVIIFIIYISIQLTLASLFKSVYQRNKRKIGFKLLSTLASLCFAFTTIILMPKQTKYTWIGGAMTFGWLSHLLGDMLTVSGVPIFFPFKKKGKRWWNYRFPLGIKAGGVIEKTLIIPLFIIISIISLIKILPSLL